MENGFDKNSLPAFDRIPSSKLGVFPLVFRFVIPRRRSVAVFTECLGDQPHHSRIVILVNEHSASAAEMVAAFASENSLATLVGPRTAGRLVASSAFKVGEGYRIVLPVAAFFTWAGTNLEGRESRQRMRKPSLSTLCGLARTVRSLVPDRSCQRRRRVTENGSAFGSIHSAGQQSTEIQFHSRSVFRTTAGVRIPVRSRASGPAREPAA